jgi:hypothetical protein
METETPNGSVAVSEPRTPPRRAQGDRSRLGCLQVSATAGAGDRAACGHDTRCGFLLLGCRLVALPLSRFSTSYFRRAVGSGRDKDPAPRALGLENVDLVLFPLSPRYCLAINKRNPTGLDRILPGYPALAEEFNAIMVHNAWWEQLYRHPDGPTFPTPKLLPERRVVIG